MIYQKKFTLLQHLIYPLFFFLHQLQDVLALHGQARTISNGDIKMDLRRIGLEFKVLTGSATFQNKGTCWKDIH